MMPEFEVEENRRLVKEVANKTYRGADADDDLDKDLGDHDLLDQRKFIDLSDDGKAYWTEFPNQASYHIEGVDGITDAIKAANGDLYTKEKPIIFRAGTKKKSYPDLAVWGQERLGGNGKPNVILIDGVPNRANPNVVIEFSWSNTLRKETDKSSVQMTEHLVELGPVNMGILIRTIPASGTEYPVEGRPSEPPLCGFDVYRVGHGERIDEDTEPSMKYRFGVDGDEDKEISVDAATVGGGFRIRLLAIKDGLIANCGSVFAMQE